MFLIAQVNLSFGAFEFFLEKFTNLRSMYKFTRVRFLLFLLKVFSLFNSHHNDSLMCVLYAVLRTIAHVRYNY